MSTTTVAGPAGDLSVVLSGEPPRDGAIVLVHPINTAAVVWERVVALLDRPSVTLDLRGHGRSTMAGPFTIEAGYLPDLVAVLDALNLSSVHLVGGSLGGPISLAAAALHPERVRSVTTLGSTLGTGVPDEAIAAMIAELEAKGTDRYFEELVPTIVGTGYREERRVLDTMRVAAGGRAESVVADILRGAFGADIRHLVDKVDTPVLAVGGSEDPTCPPAMTEEIASATGGRAVRWDGIGHLPMLEAPERVAELILEQVDG
ncbi:alpha/beta fold hydrolase [Pseudonocardia spinosispora]|uniref:alpha/beta fold hydrolase n=1 Tax=Pseudonocardia spinosispora TaxID=103441 RepID=UPI0004066B2F|nr:alpha/beta hydrolase [Pseudonocardia spinosispora]